MKIVFTLLFLFHLVVFNAQEIQLVSKDMSECMGHEHENYLNVQYLDSGLVSMDFVLMGNCNMNDSINYRFYNDTLKLDYGFITPTTEIETVYDTIRNTNKLNKLSLTPLYGDYAQIVEEDTVLWTDSLLVIKIDYKYQIIEHYDCECTFCFQIIFSGLDTANLIVIGNENTIPYFPEGVKIYEETFDFHLGEKINFTDRYGKRQGQWIYCDDEQNEEYIIFYKNNSIIHTRKFHFRTNGTLLKEYRGENVFEPFLIINYDDNETEISREYPQID